MSKEVVTKVEQLVSKFDSGYPVDSLLLEINAIEDNVTSWVYELDLDLQDFFLVVHEDVLFMVDADVEDMYASYDVKTLLSFDADRIKKFVDERLDWCFSCDPPSIHFHTASANSVISVLGEPAGQAGMHYYDMRISKTRSERVDQLVEDGYIFSTESGENYPDGLLLEKYKTLIVDRFR